MLYCQHEMPSTVKNINIIQLAVIVACLCGLNCYWENQSSDLGLESHCILSSEFKSIFLVGHWLGTKKSIWPVKIEQWGVGVVICLEQGADCLHIVQLMPLHPKTPSSLPSFKSRLFLPFQYRLTQVVPEKRPLNGCSVVLVVLVGLELWLDGFHSITDDNDKDFWMLCCGCKLKSIHVYFDSFNPKL